MLIQCDKKTSELEVNPPYLYHQSELTPTQKGGKHKLTITSPEIVSINLIANHFCNKAGTILLHMPSSELKLLRCIKDKGYCIYLAIRLGFPLSRMNY